ncbi:MAG TPA: hypothetical protein VGB13_05390 [Candidatus Krumholzibacteria bacterium]
MSAKQDVTEMLRRMPDDATPEDILYTVYLHMLVERGMEDVREGRTLSHEEVMQNVQHWLHTGEWR